MLVTNVELPIDAPFILEATGVGILEVEPLTFPKKVSEPALILRYSVAPITPAELFKLFSVVIVVAVVALALIVIPAAALIAEAIFTACAVVETPVMVTEPADEIAPLVLLTPKAPDDAIPVIEISPLLLVIAALIATPL